MKDYSNLINLYEAIINELSDELVNRVAAKRDENAKKAWQEMIQQHGERKSIRKMLNAAAKKAANEILTKQRKERQQGIEHDPKDIEDLKVQREEIRRTSEDFLEEDARHDSGREHLNLRAKAAKSQEVAQQELAKANEHPNDELAPRRLLKYFQKTYVDKVNADNAQAAHLSIASKFPKNSQPARVLKFQPVNASLLDTLKSLENLITEMFNTGISGMMDAQPNPVVGAVSMAKQRKGTQKRGQLGYKYLKIRKATMN